MNDSDLLYHPMVFFKNIFIGDIDYIVANTPESAFPIWPNSSKRSHDRCGVLSWSYCGQLGLNMIRFTNRILKISIRFDRPSFVLRPENFNGAIYRWRLPKVANGGKNTTSYTSVFVVACNSHLGEHMCSLGFFCSAGASLSSSSGALSFFQCTARKRQRGERRFQSVVDQHERHDQYTSLNKVENSDYVCRTPRALRRQLFPCAFRANQVAQAEPQDEHCDADPDPDEYRAIRVGGV